MNENFEISRNIYYSLTDGITNPDMPTHRTAKLLSLLCQHLVEKNLIAEGTLTALLDEAKH